MFTVSVIIPTYNRAHLITKAIGSVLNQTYTDFELIVVDDGSTDNTENVVDSFNDARLRYLKRPHKGPSATRNAGIEAAKGEFIAFLDSDDLFLPQKLSLQMDLVEADPAVGLVYGKYFSKTGAEGPMKTAGLCYPHLELRNLLLGPAFHWSTVMVRRTLLEEAGKFDETSMRFEDWEVTLRLALVGCVMSCVPEPVSIILKHPISNTRDQHQYISTSLAIIDKTFSDPRMPLDLMGLQDFARASQLLRIAASAYATSQLELGRDILQRAFVTCPGLMNEHIDFAVDILVYRIRGLSLDDPEKVLHQVLHYLPGDNTFLRKLKPKLWGRFYEIAAFQSYQLEQRAQCMQYVIRALSKAPSYLRNRGLLSIFVRSLTGNLITNEAKRLSSTLQTNDGR